MHSSEDEDDIDNDVTITSKTRTGTIKQEDDTLIPFTSSPISSITASEVIKRRGDNPLFQGNPMQQQQRQQQQRPQIHATFPPQYNPIPPPPQPQMFSAMQSNPNPQQIIYNPPQPLKWNINKAALKSVIRQQCNIYDDLLLNQIADFFNYINDSALQLFTLDDGNTSLLQDVVKSLLDC